MGIVLGALVAAGLTAGCGKRASPEATPSSSASTLTAPTAAPVPAPEAAPSATAAGGAPRIRIEELDLGSANLICARYANGHVRCGSNNFLGQLGMGERASDTTLYEATEVAGITDARRLATGGAHACVLGASGVQCWGSGIDGEVGNGAFGVNPSPQEVAGLDDATEIVAGNSHTCAIRASGAVACWGYNDEGQLGDGTNANQDRAVAVKGVTGALHLALGLHASCALARSGRAVCWGRLGSAKGGAAAVEGLTGIKVLALTQTDGACAFAQGAVRCWGSSFGKVPRVIAGVTDVVAMDGGNFHMCARAAGGHVMCWEGADPAHALEGDNGPIASARLVTASAGFTCVVTDAGDVVCPNDNPLATIAAQL